VLTVADTSAVTANHHDLQLLFPMNGDSTGRNPAMFPAEGVGTGEAESTTPISTGI
jgi:hypothetical protein